MKRVYVSVGSLIPQLLPSSGTVFNQSCGNEAMVRKQVPTSVATVLSLVRLFGHQTLRINLMMHRTMEECLHSTIKTMFVVLDSLLCVIVYLLPAIGPTYW